MARLDYPRAMRYFEVITKYPVYGMSSIFKFQVPLYRVFNYTSQGCK